MIWRHYNDSTDIFWLSGNSPLPGGTWVSRIVKNALNITTRYGVYLLLSFCNVSCQCEYNFIGFSGKTLFSCHLSFHLFWLVQISFLFIINCCCFVCSSPYEVLVRINGEIPSALVLLYQSQYPRWAFWKKIPIYIYKRYLYSTWYISYKDA